MTNPHEPSITLIDGERELHLPLGTHLSFGPWHWITPKELFLFAACTSNEFDARPVVCQNILPGMDLCIMVKGDDVDALQNLWPSVACFIEHWVDTRAGQTQSMQSLVGYDWVTLCQHGVETFDDVALTIERVWPSSVANAGARLNQ